jgi:hypothetical protein
VRPGRLPIWLGELVVLAAAGVLLLWAMRDFTFLMDEWDFLQGRLEWRGEVFLFPHNQHLLALDVLLYKLLFEAFGIHDYVPYAAMGVLAHLLCAGLLFEFTRGRLGAALAAVLVAPVLVLGSGRFVVLFPFNIQWTISLAALIGILFLLERPGRGRDLAICLLLAVAISASSLGIPMAVAVGAVLALDRASWARLWVPALPLALYLAWYADYGVDAGKAPGYELTASPLYLFHTVAGGVGGLFGIPLAVAPVADRPYIGVAVHLLTLALAAGLAIVLVRERTRLSAAAIVVIVTTALYWLTLTITRGYINQPYGTQYVYVSVVLIVLIAATVFRAYTVPPLVVAGVALAMAVSVVLNLVTLLDYAGDRRHSSRIVVAEATAIEIARDTVEFDYKPDADEQRAPQLRAGAFLRAADRLGSSPAVAPAELDELPEVARTRADQVLTEAQRVRATPYTEAVRRFREASGGLSAACRRVEPGPDRYATASVRLGRAGAVVEPRGGPVELRLRRFAPSFPAAAWRTVDAATLVTAPRGRAARPWRLQARSRAALELC